ncbi:MAG: hypothetical protein RL508_733 [Actinomycetota bacterium]|jgi:uncharacterized protein with PQ loop repeat
MLHVIAEIFGFIGGAIGVATGVPQMMRIRRLGHSDGLALSPWILMYVQFAAWTGFGLRVGSPAIWVANLLTFFTTALVVTAVKGNSVKNWLVILGAGAVTGVAVFYGPIVVVNWAMIVLTASRLPQLIRTWINRATVKPTAVSVSSLLIAVSSMACWGVYSVLNQNAVVMATTAVALSITLATALLESRIARRAQLAAA